MANKLFCTFSNKDQVEDTLKIIIDTYTILYDKIFILETDSEDEYVCTYNVDTINVNDSILLPNTILTHRRKETNTLYTINALNHLIMESNDGRLDRNFVLNWVEYRNSILLTRVGKFVKMNTKINRIVVLD